jgi:hypothetical protein
MLRLNEPDVFILVPLAGHAGAPPGAAEQFIFNLLCYLGWTSKYGFIDPCYVFPAIPAFAGCCDDGPLTFCPWRYYD